MRGVPELSCPKCRYSLTTHFVQELDVVTCPECGAAVERKHAAPREPRGWFQQWIGAVLIGLPVPVFFFFIGLFDVLPRFNSVLTVLICSGPLISLLSAWFLFVRRDCPRPIDHPKPLFVLNVFVGAVIANYAAFVLAGIAALYIGAYMSRRY